MSSQPAKSRPSRAEIVTDLRRRLARMEGLANDGDGCLSFGAPALDEHLPQGGLAFGAVHEIAPAGETDLPAAFGFLIALLGRLPGRAPLLLVLSSRKLARCGTPYGHGLAGLGLDPTRLILVETANETEALWTTEEAVRARGPAAVAAVLGGKLDLKASQRLLHAARDARLPLLLLRPGGDSVVTATTRWRIGAAQGGRDRFGMLAGWRWHVALERCRNGRAGEWKAEFDHATHRFGLAAPVAGASLARCGAAEATNCGAAETTSCGAAEATSCGAAARASGGAA
jgi:protein ImuA